MGLAFRRLHSYGPALWAFVAFMLVASAAILCLGPYRYPAEARAKATEQRAVDTTVTGQA